MTLNRSRSSWPPAEVAHQPWRAVSSGGSFSSSKMHREPLERSQGIVDNGAFLGSPYFSSLLALQPGYRGRRRVLSGRYGGSMVGLSLIHISEPTRPY